MRVIAGEAGGIRLARPPGGVRPVSDRAREGLFASLGRSVLGARCADLFAGTGALGIEALSRGAARCEFVERNPAAARTIRANLERTGLAGRARVIRADADRFLNRGRGRFDLIFLDPPYAYPARDLRRVLGAVPRRLAPAGRLVLTRPRGSSTDVIPVDFTIARRLAYGDSLVLICQEGR